MPSIAIDGFGNKHVVWQDQTDGEWGTDDEIMYSRSFVTQSSDNGEPINPTIISFPDPSISLLSPLGLGIICIAVAATVIITVIITKKIRE